jgi:hypothetical protein
MVCFAQIGRHQLCHGPRRVGGALGPVLARASLPMKEWGSDPEEKPDQWLRLEAVLLGFAVIVACSTAAYLLVTPLLGR